MKRNFADKEKILDTYIDYYISMYIKDRNRELHDYIVWQLEGSIRFNLFYICYRIKEIFKKDE